MLEQLEVFRLISAQLPRLRDPLVRTGLSSKVAFSNAPIDIDSLSEPKNLGCLIILRFGSSAHLNLGFSTFILSDLLKTQISKSRWLLIVSSLLGKTIGGRIFIEEFEVEFLPMSTRWASSLPIGYSPTTDGVHPTEYFKCPISEKVTSNAKAVTCTFIAAIQSAKTRSF